MYRLHDGGLTFPMLSVISVKRYPTIRNATLMITKRILRLMAFLWLLVFVLVTLRFWDTKAVFFRPVLMALTVLCTCMNVSCYGKVFLLFRRYRQELFRPRASKRTRLLGQLELRTLNQWKESIHGNTQESFSHHVLHLVVYLFVLSARLCLPNHGSHCPTS